MFLRKQQPQVEKPQSTAGICRMFHSTKEQARDDTSVTTRHESSSFFTAAGSCMMRSPSEKRLSLSSPDDTDDTTTVSHPTTGSASYIMSNHIMVNRARNATRRVPYRRSRHLDMMATQRAKEMAAKRRVDPLSHKKVYQKLGTVHKLVKGAEIVLAGPSVSDMHSYSLQKSQYRRLLMSGTFTEMGMGTAAGRDGKLYMAQYFR